jgi:hypothetical protein
MKKTKIICLLLLLSCFTAKLIHGDILETERFVIHYEGVNRVYARLIADYAEKSYARVSDLLGQHITHKVDIVVAQSDERFRELTNGRLPDWSAAVAIGSETIILSPLEGHKQDLAHIISHEIAHILINETVGRNSAPRWFHEGVAEMVSGGIGIRGRIYLMVKTIQNDLLTFEEIENIFITGQADAALAYDQAMLAIMQLVEEHGRMIIRDILVRMNENATFEQAFTESTGTSVESFEYAYQMAIRKHYGYGAIVISLINTWTVILGLSILAYIIMKIRTRRIMKRWEEEDSTPEIFYFPDGFDHDDQE